MLRSIGAVVRAGRQTDDRYDCEAGPFMHQASLLVGTAHQLEFIGSLRSLAEASATRPLSAVRAVPNGLEQTRARHQVPDEALIDFHCSHLEGQPTLPLVLPPLDLAR